MLTRKKVLMNQKYDVAEKNKGKVFEGKSSRKKTSGVLNSLIWLPAGSYVLPRMK